MAVSISLSITQNSQNITNNTSNVTVKVTAKWTYGSYNATGECYGSITIDGTKYSFTGIKFNTGKSTSGSQTIMTKTVNVSHASDGTKTLSCSASFYTGVSSGTVTASGSKTLTTIPRKSTLSVANGTLGTAQTLTVARKSTSFTHTITASCGSASTTIATKSGSTSISFTPPLSWASQNTTGTSVSVKYTITTYNGSTSIGNNSYTVTCSIPSSVKPSCSVAVSDPTGYADTYGGYIKGLSKFNVVVTPTTSYESAIASYSTTANGTTYTAASFTTGVLKTSGTLTVKATVRDKRGRSGSASSSCTVLDYAVPVISKLTVGRCNADGTTNDQGEYVKVTFSGKITSLNSKNSAKYTLEYKKSSDETYSEFELSDYDGSYSVTDGECIFAADTASSYDVRLTATDNFDSVPRTTSVSTGFTLMHWLANGLGMALGKVAELAGVLDIGFKTKFSGGILQPVLEDGTDLDTVILPNVYSGNAASSAGYVNCPITSGTSFTLEVMSAGDEGQLLQRLTTCTKAKPIVYERFYYSSSWGEWLRVSDFGGKLLWSGGYYMTANHTVTLSEAVSKQKHGIVLVFSLYSDGSSVNTNFSQHFVSKYVVAQHSGSSVNHDFHMGSANHGFTSGKTLYIYDDKIVGSAANGMSGTGADGITYNNNAMVLRYVIGV